MPNFISAGWIEPFDLVCSLKSRLGSFTGTGTRYLHLRGATKAEPDEYRDTRELARWPEVRAVLDRLRVEALARQTGEIEFGRIYLEMLDSGHGTRPRRDDSGIPWLRLIVGLRTNPSSYLWCPPEQRVLATGEVVITSPMMFHGTFNGGSYSRIHLIVDVKGNNHHVDPPVAEDPGYLQ